MPLSLRHHLSKMPSFVTVPTGEEQEGYLRAQRLAFRAVKEISGLLAEGWTEVQAAKMINTYLRDAGVSAFFHQGFAWFGERSGFEGMRKYQDFMPSSRVLLPGDAYILDVAPIFRGFACDIGYTGSLGPNPDVERAIAFLKTLKEDIPHKFQDRVPGSEIWKWIDKRIVDAGYANAYVKYPFSVLGHRIHRVPEWAPKFQLLNFGWQSYWSLASRGLFGQLLNQDFSGNLTGLWAIEPHLSGKNFGAKFEEILVVTETEAFWLDKTAEW